MAYYVGKDIEKARGDAMKEVILEKRSIAQVARRFGKKNFPFKMVQSDNGAEFQKHFQGRLNSKGIKTRHSRVRHPNDDAHIERFNRTLRKECIGPYNPNKDIGFVEHKLSRFINYYNYNRIHLGINLQTPYEMLQRC